MLEGFSIQEDWPSCVDYPDPLSQDECINQWNRDHYTGPVDTAKEEFCNAWRNLQDKEDWVSM